MIIIKKIMRNMQLFDIAGGGPETDAFKHLAAAFSVLRYFLLLFRLKSLFKMTLVTLLMVAGGFHH